VLQQQLQKPSDTTPDYQYLLQTDLMLVMIRPSHAVETSGAKCLTKRKNIGGDPEVVRARGTARGVIDSYL